MATEEEIAEFVQRRVALGRVQPGVPYWYAVRRPNPYYEQALPSADVIAAELVRDAEFRALQLGGFLNTPTGEFVESAVARVVPRSMVPEFGLIVAALKIAADLQQGESRGKVALAAGGTVLVGFILKELGRAA